MTLSEAIRLGAMLKPQGFGIVESGGRTCALGAAYDALGWLHSGRLFADLAVQFPILDVVTRVQCPVCPHNGYHMIPHLNDDHRWTREAIADWVETIEQQQDRDAIASRVDAGQVPV